MSELVVDFSHIRGWSYLRGLIRCYEPISYHEKRKSTASKALTVHLLLYFSYAMRYSVLIDPFFEIFGVVVFAQLTVITKQV